MVSDVFLHANSVYHFEECINDMDKYAKLTDHILKEIEYSSDPVSSNANNLNYYYSLSNKISYHKRGLFK